MHIFFKSIGRKLHAIILAAVITPFLFPGQADADYKWKLQTLVQNLSADGQAAVVFQNKIIVIGGRAPGEHTTEVWSSSNGINWLKISEIPVQHRYSHAAVVFQNAIWVVGGINGVTGTPTNDVWKTTDGINWTLVTNSANFTARNGHTLVVFQSKMWLMGGEGGVNNLAIWTSENGVAWTQQQSAPFPERRGHGCIVFQNKIWVMGGYVGSAPSGTQALVDVWSSFNGTTWQQHPTFHQSNSPYLPIKVNAVEYRNKLWVLEVIHKDAPEDLSAYVSSDGNNWSHYETMVLPYEHINFPSVTFKDSIWSVRGLGVFATRDVYNLNVVSTNGHVSKSPDLPEYEIGETVQLIPTPNSGYSFSGWTGNVTSRDSIISVLIDGHEHLEAHFSTIEHRTLDVRNIDGHGGEARYTILDGNSQTISAAVPPRKTFMSWQVRTGNEFITIGDPEVGTTSITLSGGDATIEALFDEPKVQVWVRDDDYRSKHQVKPIIKIKNISQTYSLTDFDLNFYFNTECISEPVMEEPGSSDWDMTLSPENGLYKVVFTYHGTLLPGQEIPTPTGLALFYPAFADTCITCPSYWEKNNDWSLIGAGREFKELKPTEWWAPLVVVDHPGPFVSDTVFGRVPGSQLIFRPAAPTLGSEPFFHPLDPPTSQFTQIPNLTTSSTFPSGNFVRNGSFEHGKVGWQHLKDSSCAETTFQIGSHGPVPLQAAVDGFHYARVDICSSFELQGILFEIKETEPAFKTLLNAGVATFSAWVRSDGAAGASAQAIFYEDSATVFSGSISAMDGEWKLLQVTVNTGTPLGTPGERVFQFGIAQGSWFTGSLYIDGATLVQGYAYIPPQQTSTWTNTRNAVMQKRTLIPSEPSPYGYDPRGGQVIVTNMEYDSLGRVSKSYLPIANPCPSGACNPFFDSTFYFSRSLDSANRRYLAGNAEGLPNADSFAYSETIYDQDFLASVLKVGAPGRNFQIKDSSRTVDGREHAVRIHYAGVYSLASASLGSDFSKPANTFNPVYAYLHRMDQDKNEAMEWKNGFGQVVKTASVLVDGATKRVIATENIFDDRGNLVKELPPIPCQDRNGNATGLADCVTPTSFAYDAEGRMVEEFTADTDTSRYFYDLLGTKRIVQSAEQRSRHALTVSVYDEHGRVRYTGEYLSPSSLSKDTIQKRAEDIAWPGEADANLKLFAKYFYDEMPPPIPEDIADYNAQFGRNVHLYPELLEGTFQNTKGRLCAVITYQNPVEAFDSATLAKVEEYATTAYRYDQFGRVTETYKYNGFILDSLAKLQKSSVSYDVSGRIVRTDHFYSGEIFSGYREAHHFSYNTQGQLKGISNNSGKTLAAYSYYPSTGQAKTVELDKFGANPITIDYTYTISGAVRSINAVRKTGSGPEQLYAQDLYYDLLPTGSLAPARFNGVISQMEYQFESVIPSKSRVGYSYDNLNRLLDAVFYLESGGVTNRSDRFSESIRYKDDGRIHALRRGMLVTNTSGGEYHYFPGKNRLAYVEPGMDGSARDMQGAVADPNFAFDSSGRMVSDRSRKVQIKYDYRNRPLEFTYDNVLGRHKDVMRYDEDGNRISKIQMTSSEGLELDEMLVDPAPSRDRDFGMLYAALEDVEDRLGAMTQDPGNVVIHVVPGGNGEADLAGIDEIQAFTYPVGVKDFELVGMEPGSDEYEALLDERNENFQVREAIHYTGIGNEIREAPDTVSGQFTSKLLLDMPHGLGRYEHNSYEGLFYLKNHLGSTVVTASSDATSANEAFDYFPYGLQEKLIASGGDKVTPTFTGKELDDGLGLYYFGARYLDPELGMWISPDAARQFASPYAYSPNPINSIDPDGNLQYSSDFTRDEIDMINQGWEDFVRDYPVAYVVLETLFNVFGFDLNLMLAEGHGPNVYKGELSGASGVTRALTGNITLDPEVFEKGYGRTPFEVAVHELGHNAEYGTNVGGVRIPRLFWPQSPDLSNHPMALLRYHYNSAVQVVNDPTNPIDVRRDRPYGYTATGIIRQPYVPK